MNAHSHLDPGRLHVPVTLHWDGQPPVAIGTGSAFRPPRPPLPGSPDRDAQITTLPDASAHLDDQQNAVAAYWANFSGQPPSHLLTLTKFTPLRDDMRMDADITVFLAAGYALHETSIATWDATDHDDLRPVTGIRRLGRGHGLVQSQPLHPGQQIAQ